MKKIICLLTVLTLILSFLTACKKDESVEGVDIRIGGLKGPTSIGLVNLIDSSDKGETKNKYELTVYGSADEVTPKLLQGELDIAAVPANLASVLYNNTDGKYALDILYETIPADILQSEIDTCWVHFAGVNPVEYLKKFKGRAPVVHLKDFTADDTSSSDTPYDLIMSNAPKKTREESHFKFQPLGYGKQDIPSLLEACEYVGAKYVIVEQDVSTDRTGLEDAEISRNTLKKYGW